MSSTRSRSASTRHNNRSGNLPGHCFLNAAKNCCNSTVGARRGIANSFKQVVLRLPSATMNLAPSGYTSGGSKTSPLGHKILSQASHVLLSQGEEARDRSSLIFRLAVAVVCWIHHE